MDLTTSVLTELKQKEIKLRVENENLAKQVLHYKSMLVNDVQAVISKLEIGNYNYVANCDSLEMKKELLENACLTFDADVILIVVLFLKQMLQPFLFCQFICAEKDAVGVYVSHLRNSLNKACVIDEKDEMFEEKHKFICNFANGIKANADAIEAAQSLAYFYHFQRKYFEEALVILRLAYMQTNARQRLRMLQFGLNALNRTNNTWYQKQVKDHIQLLEIEIQIEAGDTALTKARNELIFVHYPRTQIIDATLSSLLFYCLFYHPLASADNVANANTLRENYKVSIFTLIYFLQVSEKRWTWISLQARAKIKDWEMVKNLTLKKGFIFDHHESVIGFNIFVDVLSDFRAPLDLISMYVNLIKDSEERFQCCLKNHLYDFAIDACYELRDQVRLRQLQNKIMAKFGEKSRASQELIGKISKLLTSNTAWRESERKI